MIEELFPTAVSFVAQVYMDDGVVSWFDGCGDQFHSGLFWCSAAFFAVAPGTCTDQILPCIPAPGAAWNDVVQRKLRHGKLFTAVLAEAPVTCIDIPAVKLHPMSRQSVVKEQSDDSGHGDVEADGTDPVVFLLLELLL